MAKVIMVQGTMSNVGKSLLTAGLCRIFREDGLRAAPFKSQNMALNSYITADGLEMGRAQVMQAEAAGIEPEVCMNPILLKPTSHTGSQLIVNGEVRGNYSAAEYFKMKSGLIPDIMNAYRSLERRFDVIVVEGAGSPAEINLRENDIVNMGLADLLDAPVLLVGDIDRGGVFAQLYGTAALLSESERARIKAFVINKFRGDKKLLEPGLSMLYERIAIPFAGVVPFMELDLDDEDSLAARLTGERDGSCGSSEGGEDTQAGRRETFASIAVIRLPRISNFTDFNALERLPGVAFSYVSRPQELEKADLIIIPGTKNTMADLKWLRESGLEAEILKRASEGAVVFGICGGFQMLGERLSDPHAVEEGGELSGMGLLPVRTVFAEKKTRRRVSGTVCGFFGGEARFEGYEIHMGETVSDGGKPFSRIRPESADVCEGGADVCKGGADVFASGTDVFAGGTRGIEAGGAEWDGCVCNGAGGTYVHGIFDDPQMQKAVYGFLAGRRGISDDISGDGFARSFVPRVVYKERQYDRLAKALRESLDMDMIYRILERRDAI